MRLRYRVLFACVTAAFLSGCASVTWHMYSPERDQQGKKAKETYAKVDPTATLTVTRKNIKAWLDEQMAVEDELWTGYRNILAQSMAHGMSLADYRGRVDARYKVLAGEVSPDARKDERKNLKLATESLASISTSNRMVGQPAPNCPALLKIGGLDEAKKAVEELSKTNVNAAAAVAANLGLAHTRCDTIQKVTANSKGGELAGALVLLQADELALKSDEAMARQLENAFEAQQKTYTESVQAMLGKSEDKSKKEAVDAAIKKLDDLVKSITQAQDAFSTKFIAEKRLESLNGLLKTYADIGAGKEVKDGNKFAIALAVFPDLRDKASKALNDAKQPYLLPLAMQKNVELAKLEAARKAIALRRQVLSERQAQVDSIDAQLDALTQAREATLRYEGPDKAATADDADYIAWKGKPLLDVMEGTGTAPPFAFREKLWRSTALFMDAEGRLRAETGKAYYRISALEHEMALTYVDSGLKQWKALLDPSVELMALYAGSGVKVTEVTSFFNSVALLWIAAAQ